MGISHCQKLCQARSLTYYSLLSILDPLTSMLWFFSWYLTANIARLADLPAGLPALPGAGGPRLQPVTRALGLLVWGYVFWLTASLRNRAK